MSNVLPLEEIEMRHYGEWVLLDEIVTEEGPVLRAGKVVFHGKDRDEVHNYAISIKPKRFAVLYFGPYPKHTILLL